MKTRKNIIHSNTPQVNYNLLPKSLKAEDKVKLTIELHRRYANLNPYKGHEFYVNKELGKIKAECEINGLDWELIRLSEIEFEAVRKRGNMSAFV